MDKAMQLYILAIVGLLASSTVRAVSGAPLPKASTRPYECTAHHVVKPNEEAEQIAAAYKLQMGELQLTNLKQQVDWDHLLTGITLCVGKPAASQCGRVALAAVDDTCATIAKRHGALVQDVVVLNPGMRCHELFLNEIVCLGVKSQAAVEEVQEGQ